MYTMDIVKQSTALYSYIKEDVNMPTVRFTVSDAYYQRLEREAGTEGCSIQDYIRMKLFEEPIIYTAAEAVRRALEKYQSGDTFTLPDLYEGEWNLTQGYAGAFGKKFYAYVEKECDDKIKFNGMTDCDRRAQYVMI